MSRQLFLHTGLLITMLLSPVFSYAGVVNAARSTIDFPHDQSYINTNQPTVTGTLLDAQSKAVSGETVNIIINGAVIGSVISDHDGVYRFFVESGLVDGQYTITAECISSGVTLAGNFFTVDTTFPTTTIVSPQEGEIITQSAFTISGITEENAMVVVFVDEDSFGEICYADESGNWSLDYEVNQSGNHAITAQATDIAGNQGDLSEVRHFSVNI